MFKEVTSTLNSLSLCQEDYLSCFAKVKQDVTPYAQQSWSYISGILGPYTVKVLPNIKDYDFEKYLPAIAVASSTLASVYFLKRAVNSLQNERNADGFTKALGYTIFSGASAYVAYNNYTDEILDSLTS